MADVITLAQGLTNSEAAWLISGLGALAFLVVIAVGIKTLFWGKNQIAPQPLIIALEKEFVNRPEYERRHSDLGNQLIDARKYAHDEIHAVRGELQSMKLAGEVRDATLHKLDERTQTHTRIMSGLDTKMDKVVERMADKVESLIRDRGARHP